MLFLAFLLTALAYAAPNVKRALSFQDIETLQLANYIENLEYALFIGGCNGFGEADFKSAGFASTFRTDICAIAQQSNFKITAISELLVSLSHSKELSFTLHHTASAFVLFVWVAS